MGDMNAIIKKTSEETASLVVFELKRQNLLKDQKETPFVKTERLLYNYPKFCSVIEDKREMIKDIQCNGLQQKSKSITSFSGDCGMISTDSEMEKIEDKIEAIEHSITVTKRFIGIIDRALGKLQNDPYFEIIKRKYFDGWSREEIAEYFDVDVTTVTRNKNRLINDLKITLFSDEVIFELFG